MRALVVLAIAVTDTRGRHPGRRLLGSIVEWQRWGIATVRPPHWRLYFKGGWGIEGDGVGTVNAESNGRPAAPAM